MFCRKKNQRQMTGLESKNSCNKCHANWTNCIKNSLNSTGNKPTCLDRRYGQKIDKRYEHLFPAKKTPVSLRTQEKASSVTHGGNVALCTCREVSSCTQLTGGNPTFGGDCAGGGVRTQAYSHAAGGSRN